MQKSKSFLFLFFAALLVLTGFAPAHGAKSEPKKWTKEEVKQLSKPFDLLTLQQISRLSPDRRLQYVKNLRKLFTDAERFQKAFEHYYAINDLSPQKRKEMYAMIFGQFAEAQDKDGGRGLYPSDKCIYAWHISNYPTSGKQQPGECVPPPGNTCTAVGGSTGIQCDYGASGLRKDNAAACVPKKYQIDSTSFCDQVRKNQSRDNRANGVIGKVIEEAKRQFNIGTVDPLSNAALQTTEAKTALRDLLDHAYDDEVYANLLYVLALFQKRGINLDLGTIDPIYAGLDINRMAGNFDDNTLKVNKLYADYMKHCDSDVDPDVLKVLKSQTWKNQVDPLAQKGFKFFEREKARIEATEAYNEVEACEKSNSPNCNEVRRKRNIPPGQPIAYTIRNILEVPECKALDDRAFNIGNEFAKIRGSYPPEAPDQPGEVPGKPEERERPEHIPVATGCTKLVSKSSHLLTQEISQCLVCPIEHALKAGVPEAERKLAEAKTAQEKEKWSRILETRKEPDVSQKYEALRATMTLACGDGQDGHRVITYPNAQLYARTYGHCSSKAWEWTAQENRIGSLERTLIDKWQTDQGYWAEAKGKQVYKDQNFNEQFKKIYGLSYYDATKLFCEEDRYKKKGILFWRRLSRLKDHQPFVGDPGDPSLNKNWAKRYEDSNDKCDNGGKPNKKGEIDSDCLQTTDEFVRENREEFSKARRAMSTKLPDALKECFEEAEENAKLHDPGHVGDMRTLHLPKEGQSQAHMVSDQINRFTQCVYNAQGGMVMFDNGGCIVHNANVVNTKLGNVRASFVRPSTSTGKSARDAAIDLADITFKTNANEKNPMIVQPSTTGTFATAKDIWEQANDHGFYGITYPGGECRGIEGTVSPVGVSQPGAIRSKERK